VTWLTGRSRDGGVDEIPQARPGRLWLAGKHAVAPDPEAQLLALGATSIVCLNERHELADRYPDYVRWLGAEAPARAHWVPIHDLHAPGVAVATALVREVDGRLARGEGVILHCGAGIGRAGTIAVAVLLAQGVPLEDALATVAAHRPMAGPEAGAQRDLLDTLAVTLRAG
jgi:hypothetical protein